MLNQLELTYQPITTAPPQPAARPPLTTQEIRETRQYLDGLLDKFLSVIESSSFYGMTAEQQKDTLQNFYFVSDRIQTFENSLI